MLFKKKVGRIGLKVRRNEGDGDIDFVVWVDGIVYIEYGDREEGWG